MAGTSISLPFSGGRLREKRERAGLNQEALAEKCRETGYELSRGQISKYETGIHKPSPEALKALVEALGIEVDALLEPAA
jgi:transcriptional regulator with XRE-family HTH domain